MEQGGVRETLVYPGSAHDASLRGGSANPRHLLSRDEEARWSRTADGCAFRRGGAPGADCLRATIHGCVEMYTAAGFADEGAGKTRLDVHQVYSHERDATRGAPQGCKATLHQLTEVVRGIR